jgi:hypothetical protein
VTEWEEIHGFRSPGEFRRFSQWLDQALQAGIAKEVPVEQPYAESMLEERWILLTDAGEVWRVVTPAPPFSGVFLRVR